MTLYINNKFIKDWMILMHKTEMRNEKTMHIDKMSTFEMLKVINEENMNAVKAVEAAIPAIEKACDVIANGFNNGGRLFYIGAGTSGRLGVVDAAECPPTFGVAKGLVTGIIAGGKECMFRAAEGEEDNAAAGVEDIKIYNLKPSDVVVGISAAGNAKYILGALEYAKSCGCTTVGITSNFGSKLDHFADIPIVTDTGAEVVTGSTRMKAGTAQKLVLNMLSTVSMIKTGKVYENLMINLKPSNEKLTLRIINIVCDITGCDDEKARAALENNDWDIRKSVAYINGEN